MRLFSIPLFLFPLFLALLSCSKDEEPMRTFTDIEGIWAFSDDYYLCLNNDNTARLLEVDYQDGESIGTWSEDVYFYEPGYNLVIYLDFPNDVEVYQVLKLTSTELQWCWVKALKENYDDGEEIGKIIGDIINEAQAGFKLDPELYQTFHRISEDKFLEILNSISLLEPW